MIKIHRNQAWYAVAVLMLASVSALLDRQILGLLVAPIRRDLLISDTQMSLLMGAAFTVFYVTLSVPMARFADAHGRRNVICFGIACWSVMTMLCGRADTYTEFFLARLGVGIGEAALGPAAVALIADLFQPDERGRALGVYAIGTFAGSGIAYIVGGVAISRLAAASAWSWPGIGAVRPWQAVFIAIGLLGILVAALVLTIREPRHAHGPAETLGKVITRLRPHLHALTYVAFGLGLSQAVNYGIAGWIPSFFVRVHGWTAGRAGIVQGALTCTLGVAGVLLGGAWSDALTRKGNLAAPLRVAIVGAMGMIVFACSYPLVGSAGVAVVILAIVNVFAALPWGAASAGVAAMLPADIRAQGTAAVFLVASLISGFLGPTAVAVLTDHVFHSGTGIRYGLAVLPAVMMPPAIWLLLRARDPYLRAVAASRRADDYEATRSAAGDSI